MDPRKPHWLRAFQSGIIWLAFHTFFNLKFPSNFCHPPPQLLILKFQTYKTEQNNESRDCVTVNVLPHLLYFSLSVYIPRHSFFG